MAKSPELLKKDYSLSYGRYDMMRKKITQIIAGAFFLSLFLTGCGADVSVIVESIEASTTIEADTEESNAAEAVSASGLAAETPEPAQEPAEEPAITMESTETSAGTETPAPVYTFTDLSAAMYAKSAVNVRDLPSTEGKRIGGLSPNQEVTVTGQCSETGWYRIRYNGGDAYVSNKYIVSEKITSDAAGQASMEQQPGNAESGDIAGGVSIPPTDEDVFQPYYLRDVAEQIFALVNAEREAAGIPALAWSEDAYNVAAQRCIEADGHSGARLGTGENYYAGPRNTASDIHQAWHDSAEHYDNYMSSSYESGAVAVYYNGSQYVAYEVFVMTDSAAAASFIL